jgi:hypothetical protein
MQLTAVNTKAIQELHGKEVEDVWRARRASHSRNLQENQMTCKLSRRACWTHCWTIFEDVRRRNEADLLAVRSSQGVTPPFDVRLANDPTVFVESPTQVGGEAGAAQADRIETERGSVLP